MVQITELKHEDKSRRRTTSTMAVLGAALVVAGTGWFAVSNLRASDSVVPTEPLSTPSASASAVILEPGSTVGANLLVPLRAKAPDSWKVFADEGYVWIDADGEPLGMSIQIGGPVLKVWDPEREAAVAVPAGGFANWLRSHPYLEVKGESFGTTSSGAEITVMRLGVDVDAPPVSGYDGVLLGKYGGIPEGQPWDEVARGVTLTETVIELDGGTMVVKASGARTEDEQAELDAALDLVLSTMTVPH